MTDLDIRIAALQAEYNEQIVVLSNRAAAAMSEIASLKARLDTAEKDVVRLTSKKRAKKVAPTEPKLT